MIVTIKYAAWAWVVTVTDSDGRTLERRSFGKLSNAFTFAECHLRRNTPTRKDVDNADNRDAS